MPPIRATASQTASWKPTAALQSLAETPNGLHYWHVKLLMPRTRHCQHGSPMREAHLAGALQWAQKSETQQLMTARQTHRCGP